MIVFVFCFMVKEEREGKRGHFFLDRGDFEGCNLPEVGERVIDFNGDGVKLKYPFKVRLFLAKSPKTYSVRNGQLQKDQRILIEKRPIDFSRQPITIQS